MLTWKNSATPEKKHVFFEGVWFFLHTLSPTGYASAANKIPTFLAILRTRRSFAATLWPWLLFGSTFSSKKNIEKVMPCDLKGVIHSTCFKFHSCSCYAMTHEILAYLDIPRCQKKSASNVSNFGSQSL